MALACQQNSYLTEFITTVKSCDAANLLLIPSTGKKEEISGYNVILEDTVLFPEGGGQPDDRGTLNDVEVLRVTRKGTEAVHFVKQSFAIGTEVNVKVDWQRRWDHMQQHSGQHLITALADQTFGFATTSWNLGERISSIELDTAQMADEQLELLEKLVNEKIREGRSMFPTLYNDKNNPDLAKVRTRGLPDDHEGPVRIVSIEGVENNMCCGTHVSNLAHLQVIKLTGVEKGKKGRINLLFLAGQRVMDYLGKCIRNEKALNNLLGAGSEQHVELVEKLQKNYRVADKSVQTLLKEIAVLEAMKYKSQVDKVPYFSLHRKEGDVDFTNTIIKEINDPTVTIFLTTGDEKGSGNFVLSGPEKMVAELGPRLLELLDGKGAGKNGRFQGRANRLSKKKEVEKLLLDYLDITALDAKELTQA